MNWVDVFIYCFLVLSGWYAGYEHGKRVGLDKEIEDFHRRLDSLEDK